MPEQLIQYGKWGYFSISQCILSKYAPFWSEQTFYMSMSFYRTVLICLFVHFELMVTADIIDAQTFVCLLAWRHLGQTANIHVDVVRAWVYMSENERQAPTPIFFLERISAYLNYHSSFDLLRIWIGPWDLTAWMCNSCVVYVCVCEIGTEISFSVVAMHCKHLFIHSFIHPSCMWPFCAQCTFSFAHFPTVALFNIHRTLSLNSTFFNWMLQWHGC